MSSVRIRAIAATIGIVLAGSPAQADVPSFCPTDETDKLIPNRVVERDTLAGAMLDQAGVTAAFWERLRTLAPLVGRTPMESIVERGRDACNIAGAKPGENQILCSDAERTVLGKVAGAYRDVLADTNLQGVPASIYPASTFFASTSPLTCKAPTAAETASAPGRKADGGPQIVDTWSIKNFRVRGSATDIVIDHAGAGYEDADKAKLNFGSDDGTSSKALVGAVGYAFPVKMPARLADLTTLNIIPFFAVDLQETRKKGQAKDVKTNAIAFGTAFQFQELYNTRSGDWGAWYVSASPQAQFNYSDDSQVLGMNILVRPAALLWGVIPITRTQQIGTSPIGWRVVLDGRWNSGIFLKQGSRTFDTSRDFSRVGFRAGLGVSSLGDFPFPFDATITDTNMWALTGKPGHLGQLKGDLTIYFTDDKIFGLEVSYARGRIEDLDGRDNKWAIGLSAKY
jgi:hypothetical protein